MNLLYKKPSPQTIEAMKKVIDNINSNGDKNKSNNNDINYITEAENKIKSETGHAHSTIVNSGNSAIMIAMNGIEGPILIPDQGAWHGFKQIAKFLNKEIIIFKTDKGLINQEILEEIAIKNNTLENSGMFITSFAGYTAEQPMNKIAKWCKNQGIIVVEDASGSITDSEKKLANGKYSDIIVGSTGSPKIINVGSGGFITTNNEKILEKSKILLKISKNSEIIAKGISTEIDFGSNNLKKTIESTKYIKDNLDNIIHPDKRGINVTIANSNPFKISKNLKSQLNVNGKSMITLCPNYNRIKEKAIAIEIKNLSIESLTDNNLNQIIEIIKKEIQ
ncbi:DegT/DnrJ/EryC1/StrS family aminotransferase [Methanobrevibacter filiformis]|uniref:TDP-4-oxo-6-deoxy-D-glucose transaminase n=1 Tax=Methanobrevibacter filiformis TaxID=55758 RepID=A0A162FID4_9EURY|nr:DegT/DnrJ/EryC1/StrS family aminotransferase [Methanobrevibacter filiformis]KZX13495.1 TDP-4-oxo-6-deoxy-D-glucose transaminase [Methanobrevibacter filiformis]